MTTNQMIASAMFGCGGLFFAFCRLLLLVPVVLSRRFRRRAVPGVGVVTGYETEYAGENGTNYHPMVAFRDESGAEHAVQVRGSTERTFEVGQQVDILLSRGQPWRVEIRGLDAYQIMRPMGIIFVVVGTGTAAWGVAIWIFKIPVTSG